MQLFEVLIKNNEQYFVYALNKRDALNQFGDVHIADCRPVDNFIDSLNDMVLKPREYFDILPALKRRGFLDESPKR